MGSSEGRDGSPHVEVERKYTLDEGSAPELRDVKGVGEVRDDPAFELRATYYDTDDLRLASRGVTLRRREGGSDAGWHLKVPVATDSRVEITANLDASADAAVPHELGDAVLGITHGRSLEAVVDLTTHREEHHLVDGDRREVAVVAVDQVTARTLRPSQRPDPCWQELEVELVDGPPAVLDRVAKVLVATGARPSHWWSKLGQALDHEVDDASDVPLRTAGDVALAYLREHHIELQMRDVAVRTSQPEGVHKMRVATRRLRSTLATFRPYLDGDRWDAVRDELKWIGELLGAVRDLDVLQDRLLAEIDDLDPLLVIGPVRARLRRELGARHQDADEALRDALRSPRYLALLEELSSLLADPPLTSRARRKPARVTGPVDRTLRRFDRALRRADDASDPADRDARLHEVRKAAKRARYAGEAVRPVFGKPAARIATRMEDVQEVLGDHNDGVTARPVLRELGVLAYLGKENGFTFGLLSGLEHEHAWRSLAAFEQMRPSLRPKDLRLG
jgi:CHAD domain-containing protein